MSTKTNLPAWQYFGKSELGRNRRHVWHCRSHKGDLIWNVAPDGALSSEAPSPTTGGYTNLAWLLSVKGCAITTAQWENANRLISVLAD